MDTHTEEVIERVFELRLELTTLLAWLLRNGVDEDALAQELRVREWTSGQVH